MKTWKEQLPHIYNTMDLEKMEKFIKQQIEDAHESGMRIGKQVERDRIKGVARGMITGLHRADCEIDNNWCVTHGEEMVQKDDQEYGRNSALQAFLEAIEGEI
jgi:transcriptional regulator of heat shock response